MSAEREATLETRAVPAWPLLAAVAVTAAAAWTFALVDRDACANAACDALGRTGDLPSIAGVTGLVSFLLVMAGVGWLVASNRPRHPVGWLFLGGALLWTGGAAARSYALHALIVDPASLPAGRLAHGIARLSESPASFVPFVLVLLLFPDGTFRSVRWRWLGWVVTAAGAIVLLAAAFDLDTRSPYGPNPFAVEIIGDALDPAETPASLVLAAGLLASIAAPLLRLRGTPGSQRQPLKWVVWAAVVVGATLASAPVFFSTPTLAQAWLVVFPLAGSTLPVAMGAAILRYRLYDIDVIINRTLLYTSLSAVLLVTYLGTVGVAGAVLADRAASVGPVLGTAVAALLAQPARQRLQGLVNRLTFGQRDEPYEILSRLGQRLEAALAPEDVLDGIVATVAEALRLPFAAIDLGVGDQRTRGSTRGDPTDHATELPLLYQGTQVGWLVAGQRTPGEELTSRDRAVLADVARQAGVAAHALQLTTDLRASRSKAVWAREEERRRLRRDLHDGLGPSLAAVSLGLETAHRTYTTSPAAGAELLDKLSTELTGAVDEIRRLVYDLRPPVLDQLGLIEAVRQEAARLERRSSVGLVITVQPTNPLPPIPAATEVAAFRIIGEALHNVVRHAAASNCTVRISAGADLQLEVTDDGRGIPADRRSGVGLHAMAERAAELEGTLTVESAPGTGTAVRAHLPLAPIR